MSLPKRMSLAYARVWNMCVGLPHVCGSRSLSYAIIRTKSKCRAGYLFVGIDWYRPKESALLSRRRCFQRVHAPVSHHRDCLLKFYFQKRLISVIVFTHFSDRWHCNEWALVNVSAARNMLFSVQSAEWRHAHEIIFQSGRCDTPLSQQCINLNTCTLKWVSKRTVNARLLSSRKRPRRNWLKKTGKESSFFEIGLDNTLLSFGSLLIKNMKTMNGKLFSLDTYFASFKKRNFGCTVRINFRLGTIGCQCFLYSAAGCFVYFATAFSQTSQTTNLSVYL